MVAKNIGYSNEWSFDAYLRILGFTSDLTAMLEEKHEFSQQMYMDKDHTLSEWVIRVELRKVSNNETIVLTEPAEGFPSEELITKIRMLLL